MIKPIKKGKKPKRTFQCHCCGKGQAFCWTCSCGFQICQQCLPENAWGLTCNNITWICPDCGADRCF
ncbi:MAG: hypothetical protein C0407_00010 [Desulfobacca sp.]|nr:hypothetical protein [Desulfobacca sp.]